MIDIFFLYFSPPPLTARLAHYAAFAIFVSLPPYVDAAILMAPDKAASFQMRAAAAFAAFDYFRAITLVFRDAACRYFAATPLRRCLMFDALFRCRFRMVSPVHATNITGS